MKNLIILLLTVFGFIRVFAQTDSLQLGKTYWEDQLYLSISYDILRDQPKDAAVTGFSYGISTGYIKDIPFTKKGNFALGVGVGYGYNSFNHDIQVVDRETIQLSENITANRLRIHSIELPLQFRWRTSDAITYSFWRIYSGMKFSYNIQNKFTYQSNNQSYEFKNLDFFRDFQTGLEFSAGYGAFNFYFYYGLDSIYENISIDQEKVNSKISRFGIIFYLL